MGAGGLGTARREAHFFGHVRDPFAKVFQELLDTGEVFFHRGEVDWLFHCESLPKATGAAVVPSILSSPTVAARFFLDIG
jgi:hypothetical protein